MAYPAFHPATLELLPGETAQPPLRLLEPGVRLRQSRPVTAAPAHWLARLRQVAGRAFLS